MVYCLSVERFMIVRGSSKMYVSGEHKTLVAKEIKFLQENLSGVRVENDNGYGFLEGTDEQKEEFLEQFTALNSTCFVRSKTEAKGSSLGSSQENRSSEPSSQGSQFK